jgi:hypothetical protein
MQDLHLSVLSIESPYPGVSTTVSLSLTPRSSISTVDASSFTVWCVFSVQKQTGSLTNVCYEASKSAAHNLQTKLITYLLHLELHVLDTDQLGKGYLLGLISPILILRQPSM